MSSQTAPLQSAVINLWIVVAILLIPVRSITLTGSGVLNLGFLMAVPLVLMALPEVWRAYRPAASAWAIIAAAVLLPIPVWASIQLGREFSQSVAAAQLGFVIKALCFTVLVLWARLRMKTKWVALTFALGLALHAWTQESTFLVNPWKYGLAIPLTLGLIAAACGLRWFLSVTVMGIASMVAALNDYRSLVAIILLTLLLGLAFRIPGMRRASMRTVLVVGLIAVLFVYNIITDLALNGLLGDRNQEVTTSQLAMGGSILGAGRQEWHASLALFPHVPLGFGPGVQPASSDIDVALAALDEAGLNIYSEHVQVYMLGSYLELHSIIADLWVILGIPGLVLGVLFIWVLGKGVYDAVVNSYSDRYLILFVGILAIWDLLFSPIYTNLPFVAFAVGLLLPIAAREANSIHRDRRSGSRQRVTLVSGTNRGGS